MESSSQPDVHVNLKGVHLCCGGCVDAVASALEPMRGVAFQCDMEHGTVTLAAKDDAVAQQALDAIAAAGLHGETGDPRLAMTPEPNVPPGMVRRLKLSGVHNCCRACYEGIKGAIESVQGVTGDTVQPELTSFEVIGDFSAAQLIGALNASGFHAKVNE